MALERRDSVRDATTTTGTGALTIAGVAPDGYRTIAAACTEGATLRVRIESQDKTQWEVSEGVWTAPTLTRATVYASSNAGALVDFSAGTKAVSVVVTAADFSGGGGGVSSVYAHFLTG